MQCLKPMSLVKLQCSKMETHGYKHTSFVSASETKPGVTYKTQSILTGRRQASNCFQAAVVTNVTTRALAGEEVEAIHTGASVQARVRATSVHVYLTV